MDDKTRQKLIEQLDSPVAKERYNAVLALGKTGDLDLLPPLARVAHYDDHAKVRDLAAKAVRTLEILEERAIEKQKLALMEEGDDLVSVEWKPLASAQLLDNESYTKNRQVQGQAEWNYMEAKKRDLALKEQELQAEKEAKLVAEKQAELDRLAYEARMRRRRRPFRIFLYVVVTFAVMLLAFLGWYMAFVETAPSNEAEALKQLETATAAQQTSIIALQEQLVKDPIDCQGVRSVSISDRPLWMGLRETSVVPQKRSGLFGATADSLSQIDEATLVNLLPIVEAVDQSYADLLALKTALETACQGKDTLPTAEWVEFTQVAAQSDQVKILVDTVAAVIQNEKIQVEPTTREEALERLQLWSDEQVAVAENYKNLLASDPLSCTAILAVTPPEKPRWIESGQGDATILGDLQIVLEALETADGNLRGVQLGVQRICQGRDILPQAEAGAAYPVIVDNSDKASITIEASRVALQAAVNPVPNP